MDHLSGLLSFSLLLAIEVKQRLSYLQNFPKEAEIFSVIHIESSNDGSIRL